MPIRDMAAGGMTFGYHTRSHRMLSRLPARGAGGTSFSGGVRWIRGLTGQATVPFCYPWGGPTPTRPDTVRLLAEAGYSVAFNTVRRAADVCADGRFELPRSIRAICPPHTWTTTTAAAVAAAGGRATHDDRPTARPRRSQAYLRAREAVLRMKQARRAAAARWIRARIGARSWRTSTT